MMEIRGREAHEVVVFVAAKYDDGIDALGTAFLTHKGATFLTCLHVVKGYNNLVIIAPEVDEYGYQDTSNEHFFNLEVEIDEMNPINDLCTLVPKKPSLYDPFVSSRIELANLDELDIDEKVVVFTFPKLKNSRIILTRRTVEIGAKILLDFEGTKVKHLVLNYQSGEGESGSPVFRARDMSLIGVIVGGFIPDELKDQISIGGINPHSLHEITHVVPAEYAKELLDI